MGISRPRLTIAETRERTAAVGPLSGDDIQEAELFMRTTPLTDQNDAVMLEKFRYTRASRRQFISDKGNTATVILSKYLRLQDMFEAVGKFNSYSHAHF